MSALTLVMSSGLSRARLATVPAAITLLSTPEQDQGHGHDAEPGGGGHQAVRRAVLVVMIVRPGVPQLSSQVCGSGAENDRVATLRQSCGKRPAGSDDHDRRPDPHGRV